MESQFCYVIVDQLRKCYRNMILLHSIQWNQTFTVHFFWKKMHNENMIQLHKLLHNRIMIPFCHNSCYTMESWFRYETNLQHNGIVIPSCNNLCNTTESWFRWFDKKGGLGANMGGKKRKGHFGIYAFMIGSRAILEGQYQFQFALKNFWGHS